MNYYYAFSFHFFIIINMIGKGEAGNINQNQMNRRVLRVYNFSRISIYFELLLMLKTK